MIAMLGHMPTSTSPPVFRMFSAMSESYRESLRRRVWLKLAPPLGSVAMYC